MTVISASTGATISTSAIGQTIIVVPGVTVAGLGTNLAGAQLINYGTLDPASSSVLFNDSGSGQFINKASGLAIGASNGVTVRVLGDVINDGLIFGVSGHGISLQSGANNNNVINSGDIYGLLGGITVSSGSALNVSISNSGDIRSDQHGIWMFNAPGAAPVIVNSGTISGRTNSILAENGDRLNVTNSGSLIGDVTATSVNQPDLVTNNRAILGDVLLGSGSDTYRGIGTVSGSVFGEAGTDNLSGGGAVDRFDGGAGADTLAGNAGNDVLTGGSGGDRLSGGLGNDNLTGGGDGDFFVFNTALNATTNRDFISDFNHVADTFQLENAIFTKLGAGVHALNPQFFRAGAAAADANDFIIYNQATGVLSYDFNGNAAGGAVAFAALKDRPALAANDFVVI